MIANGLVICFGSNRNNELGLLKQQKKGDSVNFLKDFYEPQLNPHLDYVEDIKLGLKHTIFISIFEDQKNFFGAGSNSKGVLATCNNLYENTLELTLLNPLWQFIKIDQIEVSWNNTVLLSSKKIVH